MANLHFKTSPKYTATLIYDFFAKTSMPRIKAEYYKNKGLDDEQSSLRAQVNTTK